MKLGVLEEKAQEEVPPLVLCAGTVHNGDSGSTISNRVKRHKNKLSWVWKNLTKHIKRYQGENEGV